MKKIIIEIKDMCELCTFQYYDIEFIFENNLQGRCNECLKDWYGFLGDKK